MSDLNNVQQRLQALEEKVSSARARLIKTLYGTCSSKKFLKRLKKYEGSGVQRVFESKDGKKEVIVVSPLVSLGVDQEQVFQLIRIVEAETNKRT